MSSWYKPFDTAQLEQLCVSKAEAPADESPRNHPLVLGPNLKFVSLVDNIYKISIMIVTSVPSPENSPFALNYKVGTNTQLADKQPRPVPFELFYQRETPEQSPPSSDPSSSLYFYRVILELPQDPEQELVVAYEISPIGNQSYHFFVPSAAANFNIVTFSCNGFSLATDTYDYPASLWLDVLREHNRQHYHVMLGGGDQLYADSVKLFSSELKKWTELSNGHSKRLMQSLEKLKQELEDYYTIHYLNWFGYGWWKGKCDVPTEQPLLPLLMTTIPLVNIFDDHDIIDGFGSYHDLTMSSPVFVAIGNIAYKYYMLFQHHINPEEKIHIELNHWILGPKPGPYIKQRNHSTYTKLGKNIALLGLDCRTERKLDEIVLPATYKTVFSRLQQEIDSSNGEITHLLVMLGVPMLYPRLVWLEYLLSSAIMKPVRKIAEKGVINKGLVNEFDGGVEVLDDLNDHWCARHHKHERNKLILDLHEFAAKNGVRITLLSGDVHLAAVGRLRSKIHHNPGYHLLDPKGVEAGNEENIHFPQRDPRLIFNVISSAITNAPPPDAMATLLNKRSNGHHFNKYCDEDMVPLFDHSVNGKSQLSNQQFLNRRNWADLILAPQSKYREQMNEGLVREPGYVGETLTASGQTRAHVRGDSLSSSVDVAAEPKANGNTSNGAVLNGNGMVKEGTSPVNLKGTEQSVQGGSPHTATEDPHHSKYPLTPDTLVTTIHVEIEPKDIHAKTAAYEMWIPSLEGKYQLHSARIKHLR